MIKAITVDEYNEAMQELEMDPKVEINYESLKTQGYLLIKKYYNTERIVKIILAYRLLSGALRANPQGIIFQDKNMPQVASTYKTYEANLKRFKGVNKYYPVLPMKTYLEMYAAARDKGLELNEIIEQYIRRQENRDLTNKHYDISFELYFLLYIKYGGLIDLDGYIDEYATGGKQVLKQTGLFNKKTASMSLDEFLDIKVKKEEQMLR